MAPSELKHLVEIRRSEPKYFTRKTMKFFGDTMKNYGVRSRTIITIDGETVDTWELYRKKPVNGGLKSSSYFRKDNFRIVTRDYSNCE